ncbi:MAG: hypothetical protein H6838_02010 [Planctomycetes bacterium]|nr:hypothetical protein [Planctomycetota bacterium]MCB9884233.1 hypothetical protein [Planctomycetota bacterium]
MCRTDRPRSLRRVVLLAPILAAGLGAQQQQPKFQHRLDAILRGPAPDPALLEVNGSMVSGDDLRRRCGELQADPAQHLPQVLILDVLTEELRRTGKALDDEQLAEAYEEYRKPYDATPFTVKVIATRYKGYPSLDAFVARWRVFHAFERSLGEIPREQLLQEVKRSNDFLCDGAVKVELWFFAAHHEGEKGWDFVAAEQRAAKALAALRADPAAKGLGDDSFKAVGGWPENAMRYNILRQLMGESEFTDLAAVSSAAHLLFHEAAPGEFVGPLRGPQGWWVARVVERVPPKGKLELKDDRTEKLVRDLLLERLFLEWTDEVLGRAVLRVPQSRGAAEKPSAGKE